MSSINALAMRVARMSRVMKPAIQTILLLQEVGSSTYTLSMDGSQVDRSYIDKRRSEKHHLVIRQYPTGWLKEK